MEMKDNRKVSDSHQEGISRKIQRKGDMEVGQQGKMSMKPKQMANWKRSGDKLTPRKA